MSTNAEQAAQSSKLMNQKRALPPGQKKRWWAKRGVKIGGGFLVVAVLLVLSYGAAVAIDVGPVTAYRMVTSGDSNIYSYKIFPQRAIATSGSVSTLQQASLANFPATITFSYHGSHYTTRLNDLFTQTDTQAFIVIRNNTNTDLYVSNSGSDSNPGTQASPFATINKAASIATPGTTVHVLPGIYSEAVINNNSGTATAPITFISDTKWGAKIVTGGGLTNFPFRNNGNYVKIIGFDITSTTSWLGILTYGQHNDIEGNHVHNLTGMACNGKPGGQGVGDEASGSNNIFDGNMVNNIGSYPTKCDYVHGIYVDGAGDIVENNISYNNAGNGIYVNHETGPVIFINNLSFANGEYGFGINGSKKVGGFTVANNISMGNGLAGFKTWSVITSAQYINNISFNNPINFIQYGKGTVTDTGTITADPQFVNYQANGSGDYHLKAGSPAIDTGISTNAPNHDFDGNPRPQGNGYDIGAYEYIPSGTATPTSLLMPSRILCKVRSSQKGGL